MPAVYGSSLTASGRTRNARAFDVLDVLGAGAGCEIQLRRGARARGVPLDPRTGSVHAVLRMLFVRHGESEWNAVGRWQGQADPPLSTRGRRQARAAATSLGAIDAIVASPLQRALETALILSEELGVGPVMLEPSLVERDAGQWSGLTRSEIEEAFPGYLADGRRPPGYEPDELILQRVLGAVSTIAETNGAGDVVVITHGGVIYSLEQHLGGEFSRKPNLGARWFTWHSGRLALGEGMSLLEPSAQTVPDLL